MAWRKTLDHSGHGTSFLIALNLRSTFTITEIRHRICRKQTKVFSASELANIYLRSNLEKIHWESSTFMLTDLLPHLIIFFGQHCSSRVLSFWHGVDAKTLVDMRPCDSG